MSRPALSIIQPWPWLILRPDVVGATARAAAVRKDVENRDWATAVRGWVLVHASKSRLAKWDYAAAAMFAGKRGVDVPLRENLDYGAVVGAIRIDGCENHIASPWYTGSWGFRIGAAVPFANAVPCQGSLKFFPLPPREAANSVGGQELWYALAREIRAAGLAAAFGLRAPEEVAP